MMTSPQRNSNIEQQKGEKIVINLAYYSYITILKQQEEDKTKKSKVSSVRKLATRFRKAGKVRLAFRADHKYLNKQN